MTELKAEHLLPRHCWGCWVEQPRSAFSKTQWNKERSNPVASRTCMKCITAKQEAARAKSYKTTPRDLRCATNWITDASNTITNYVLISWPAMFPIPSDIQEEFLLRTVLLPGVCFTVSKKLRQSDLRNVPLRWEDLSVKRQLAIVTACQEVGVHVKQAMGLRTTAYKGLAWWKFQGKEAESQAASEALERDVAEFLVTNGVSFETQEQQVARQASDDLCSPTPDFLIHSSLFINDQRVNWIEVKHLYGVGIVNGLPDWMPTVKIQKQIARYMSAFGPDGVVILKYGYSESLRKRTPESVQLLAWVTGSPENGDHRGVNFLNDTIREMALSSGV